MVSNQLIVDILEKAYDISGVSINVYLMDGTMIAKEGPKRSTKINELLDGLKSSEEVQRYGGLCYIEVFDGTRREWIVEFPDTEIGIISGRFTIASLKELLDANSDRFDRDNFIKNLLLDNLLLVDIYNRAKQIRIDTRSRRVAFLVETKRRDDQNALSIVRNLFAADENDFVNAIDENNIVVVKELKDNETEDDLRKTAEMIVDMLNTEAMSSVRVAYGNVADEIRKVANSYKEAKLALSVGKIFKSEQQVVSYASLGIGRLIYQLPIPMCKMFIDEIFKEQSPADFDEETIQTINQFFADSLNVSETSRKLYIHRNTLVYRLDKLQRNTGLDLRVFDDAITFKIALMVVKYMNYMENQE